MPDAFFSSSCSSQVTAEAGNGTVSFTETSGLLFTKGTRASGGRVVEVTGTAASVNAALLTLRYTSDAQWHGAETVTITADDLGHSGTGGARSHSASLRIDVAGSNDAPAVHVPGLPPAVLSAAAAAGGFVGGGGGEAGLLFVHEDEALELHGLYVTDPDAEPSDELRVTLSCAHGTLTLAVRDGSLAFDAETSDETDGQDFAKASFTGTLADINAALDGATYLGNAHYHGQDAVTVVVNDNAGDDAKEATASFTIVVGAVNDAPVVTVPDGPLEVDEDTELAVTGVSVAEPDAMFTHGAVVEVRVAVSHGKVALASTAGLYFPDPGAGGAAGDEGAAALTFRGGLEYVNNALSVLTYTPDLHWSGDDALSVSCDDLGNSGASVGSDGATGTHATSVAIAVSAARRKFHRTPDYNEESVGDIAVS